MTNQGSRTKKLFAQSGFTIAASALALLVSLPPETSAAPPPPPGKGNPPNISITAYFSDYDTQNLPSDTASDGHGAYRDSVEGVSSYLAPNGYNGLQYGDWKFSTDNSPTRGVTHSLDQDDAVQPGDLHYTAPANPPFWGAQILPSSNQLTCTLVNRTLLTMTAGSSFSCPLLTDFTAPSGVAYGLQTAPSQNGFAETTDVQVTCNTANAGGCNDWYIDPIAPGPAVGRLVHRESTSKTKSVQIDDGDFYLRFHIHLTRP
jgi:hypothetical protein